MNDRRNRAQSRFSNHERRYVLIRKITLVVMVFLVLSTFVAVELARVNRHSNSMKGDWGFYLQLGLNIRQRLALTDSSRHPLYPALLSLFAEREFGYFTQAKLLSVAIGTLGLGVVYILSRRMYSDDVALLTTFLLSVSDQYRRLTFSVMPDAFLALLFFVAWYFTVRGFSERRNWIWGGVFAGLAYLAKATGEIFVLSWVCTALVVYRTRLVLLRDKKLISYFLLFLAAFLIVASPLLVYNYKVYHSPFYNINSKHLMWLEDVEGQYVLRDADFPTASIYLKTHTWSEIMEREWTGFKTMWGVLLEALIPARTWPLYHFLRSYGGLICIVVALAVLIFCREGLVRCFHENPGKVVFTAVLVEALWLSFAWYAPFTTGARYLLPLSPILYLLIAELIWKAGREVLARFRLSDKARTAGYVAFNACLFCWMLSISAPDWKDLWRNPFQLDRSRNADKEIVMSQLIEQAEPTGEVTFAPIHQLLMWRYTDDLYFQLVREGRADSVIIYGPSHNLPVWKYTDSFYFLEIPYGISWDQFVGFVKSRGARYVILDEETVGRRLSVFEEYFDSNGEKVSIHTLPPDWELIFAYPSLPCEYCIFRLGTPASEEKRWDYAVGRSFGQEMKLMGYDLNSTGIGAKDAIDATLYWQALEPPTTRYDVLLKILTASHKVWGQQSGPLPGPFLPLEWWKPGQIVKDRRTVELLSATPPGPYYVEVHVYNPSAGEWLELEGECELLLGPVQVSRREPPAIEDLDMEHSVGAVLGERVRLLGYNIESGFRPGDNIHLTLFWQCLEEMEQSYTVFTHLVDTGDNIVAQKDNPPVDGFYPTTKWEVGEIVRDQYDLIIPEDVASGEYRVKVGMYLVETGERLRAMRGNEPLLEDAVALPPFQVHR
jgi:hypothetical protein